MRYARVIGLLLMTLTVSGCVTSLTPQASRMKPITEAQSENCQFIKTFSGGEGGRGSIGRNSRGALNKGLNDAAQAGANSYYVVSSTATGFGTSVIVQSYRCKG